MTVGAYERLKSRRDFLLKMAILKESAGDMAAAEHFLEQACEDEKTWAAVREAAAS